MVSQSSGAMGTTLRLAVLLSGSGRTLENLLGCIARKELPARVEVVVSSRDGVRGIEIARAAGLPVTVIPRREFPSVDAFSDAVWAAIAPYEVDLVILAGFLAKLAIPTAFEGRVMNIHPSLLPLFGGRGFYGDRVHRAVLEAGVKVSGCTVHFVDEEYDAGPIILQRCVPVLDDDTPESLAHRVFAEECRAYPEAIRLYAEGRLRIEGRRVRVLPRE